MNKEEFDKINVFGQGEDNPAGQYFIGKSYLNPLAKLDDINFSLFNVTFEPGCRNNWHIHHATKGGGQVLICIAGEGWYKEEGKEAISLEPGKVITIPANVKHWHGAKKDSWFSHIAVEVPGENTSNEWCEEVTDEEYNKLYEENMKKENYLESVRKYVGHKPLLTVGAWLLVYNDKNEVLMQLRSDFNSWDFPGGTLELNESIEEAARRELKEETNLEMDDFKILDIFSGEKAYRKYPNGDELYVVSVLCEIRKYHGTLKINDDESEKLEWIPINKIPDNLSPVTKNYIENIKKYLK